MKPAFRLLGFYEYNEEGQVIRITDAVGRQTRYTYKEGGLLDSIFYPDGTKESFYYDEIGNLVEKYDRREMYTHDAHFVLF